MILPITVRRHLDVCLIFKSGAIGMLTTHFSSICILNVTPKVVYMGAVLLGKQLLFRFQSSGHEYNS